MRAQQTGHAYRHDQGSPLVQRRPRPPPVHEGKTLLYRASKLETPVLPKGAITQDSA
jgi:hypothetical protein